MEQLAVYAGSFDPPTSGHAWMIERSASLFSRVVVAVARNPEKSYTFPVEDRIRWLRRMTAGYANVEVDRIEHQFLAHFAKARGANYVVRGIRNEADYAYERAMRYVNEDLGPGLTTVFLIPPRELCEVSSGFVKGLVGPEGWQDAVRRYLPAEVYADLVAWAGSEHRGSAGTAADGATGDGG